MRELSSRITHHELRIAAMLFANQLVVVRGGGDLATGVIYRLHKAGFPVVVLELARPLVVRWSVAVATAVWQGHIQIESMTAQRVDSFAEAVPLAQTGVIPVLVSPQLPSAQSPAPILIDARMAKRNLDTSRAQADFVVALGPGFSAGQDCHAVVETMRGHTLGRVIWQGAALPNTGTPGIVAGKGAERVLRAPVAGVAQWQADIGDVVQAGQPLGVVGAASVYAPFAGVVRGLIRGGTAVSQGLKIGDVDPRADREACFTISDKALAVGGGVLEAVLTWMNGEGVVGC
jgi:xanthine dehydrogenase accessory factor